MFLLLLCLGIILALICPASWQPSCSPPPSSESVGAAWFHPYSRCTTAPTQSCAAAPAPSPSESGRGTRWSPSAGLRLARPRRHAWQPKLPRQTTGFTPRLSCRNQAGLVFRPAGFFTVSSGTATRRSQNRFPTRRGGFCMPGTGGAITGATDAVPVPSTGTATEVGPLISSPPSRGQSSGGALWTPAYIPGDRPASWMYSTTCVQYLYISCYLSDNKSVLSYLLCFLPQDCTVQ